MISKKSDVAQRLRIRVQAYDYRLLEQTVKRIIEVGLQYNISIIGPILLPTRIKKYTVNRSSHVYSKSRDQFEVRMHTRILDIPNPSQQVVEALTSVDLPVGVNIGVKLS